MRMRGQVSTAAPDLEHGLAARGPPDLLRAGFVEIGLSPQLLHVGGALLQL
jgi:hypothetical protein